MNRIVRITAALLATAALTLSVQGPAEAASKLRVEGGHQWCC